VDGGEVHVQSELLPVYSQREHDGMGRQTRTLNQKNAHTSINENHSRIMRLTKEPRICVRQP
jgi:hypothetical protein